MDDLVIRKGLVIPERELSVHFARSGGPGGQHVNKVETKVEIRFSPASSSAFRPEDKELLLSRLQSKLTTEGELIVSSDRTRHQHRNREDALQKLAEMLRAALVRVRKRRPTKPSRGSVERRLKAKKGRSDTKQQRRSPIE